MNLRTDLLGPLLIAVLVVDTAGIGLLAARSMGGATAAPRTARLPRLAPPPGHWSGVGPRTLVHALATDPARAATVYAATSDGFLRSDDHGARWRFANGGLPPSARQLWGIATGANGAVVAASDDGHVYRSGDGGGHWRAAGGSLGGSVYAVSVDPGRAGLLLAGADGGIFRTLDGGAHWRLVYRTANNGATAFARAPGSATILAGLLEGPGQLLRSDDDGARWRVATRGIDADEGIMSLLALGTPRPAFLAGTMGHRVWRWGDGASAWRRSGDGLPGDEHGTGLAVDGAHAWVSTMARGVYGSADAGLHWAPYGSGLDAPGLMALALARSDRYLLVGTSEGVYRIAIRVS